MSNVRPISTTHKHGYRSHETRASERKAVNKNKNNTKKTEHLLTIGSTKNVSTDESDDSNDDQEDDDYDNDNDRDEENELHEASKNHRVI